MSNEIELAGHKISSDNGLYLMRDVYKASAAGPTKKPDIFFRNKGTMKLLSLLDDQRLVRKRGYNGGVWASDELVCAYAMWVSPEFYLKVIRTFMAVAKGSLVEAANIADTEKSRLAAMKLATAFIDADKTLMSRGEKEQYLIQQAERVASGDTYMDRIISKTQVAIQQVLHGWKDGLTKYETVHAVVRNSYLSMGGYYLDPDAVLHVMDEMAEAGTIIYKDADRVYYNGTPGVKTK